MAGRTGHSGFNITGPLANFFKMGGNAKDQSLDSTLKAALKERQVPGMSLNMQLWVGARLPFLAFILILGAFTYLYHFSPILPWLFVFLAMDFAILVTWPPKEIGIKRRTFWDWGPMLSWIVAVCFAVTLGLTNYAIIEGWVNTTFLREYHGVKFDTDPRAVGDAGILNFAKGSVLDTASAAGYKHWWDHYCAAPVISKGDPTSAPVGFWAVGLGCCDSRGDFKCNGAGEVGANSGMPIRPHNLGEEKTASFNKAIKMAAAANGLEVAKETVLMTWVKDPHSAGKGAWWTATILFLSLTFVGLCACCACQQGLTHIHTMEM